MIYTGVLGNSGGVIDGSQLSLDLPDTPDDVGRIRVWLLAAEPRVGVRLAGGFGGPPIAQDARHVFIDAENGSPAFAPSDLILVRRRPGADYTLMVAADPNEETGRMRHLAALLREHLLDPDVRGIRGATVCNITCLSYPNARMPMDVPGSRITRSRLERALDRLSRPDECPEPLTMLGDCRTAAMSLADDAHPSLDALLDLRRASSFLAMATRTGDFVYGSSATPLFERSQRAFVAAGLRHIARLVEREAGSGILHCQPCLPGLSPPARRSERFEGAECTVVPAMAFAIDLDLGFRHTPPRRWTVPGSIPRYRSAGRIEIDDARIFEIVDAVRSPSRRLVSRVTSTSRGYSIRLALLDSMQALLGLSTASGGCRGMEAISIHSTSLAFDPPGLEVEGDGPVDIHAETMQTSCGLPDRHEVDVRVLMSNGGTTRLGFVIPAKVAGDFIYA